MNARCLILAAFVLASPAHAQQQRPGAPQQWDGTRLVGEIAGYLAQQRDEARAEVEHWRNVAAQLQTEINKKSCAEPR